MLSRVVQICDIKTGAVVAMLVAAVGYHVGKTSNSMAIGIVGPGSSLKVHVYVGVHRIGITDGHISAGLVNLNSVDQASGRQRTTQRAEGTRIETLKRTII